MADWSPPMELPPLNFTYSMVFSIRAGRTAGLGVGTVMRGTFVASLLLAFVLGVGDAPAAECPPDALGVSRAIVVDPSEHPRVGGLQYSETLPLNDKEVVLTFDDGPLPRYTSQVIETLASECTKATFFMVGQMANAYPAMVRRVHDEGHTIANHSQTHPFSFQRMGVEQAAAEIEGGFASLRAALGDRTAVAPFFRFPGLLRQNSVEQYLAAHDVMTWSLDVVADDWTHIRAEEIARRAVSRLETNRKGILLLHDIHATTARALPIILKELKARGFKIVHVVPASPDRPKTVTTPEQWATHMTREQKLWPRVVDVGITNPEPALLVPRPQSFGVADPPGREVQISLVRSFERPPVRRGDVPLPPITPWPRRIYSVPAEVNSLAVPDAQHFQYVHVFELPHGDKPTAAARKRTASAQVKPKALNHQAAPFTNQFGVRNGIHARRLFGHQL